MEKPVVFLSHSSADKAQLTALKTLLDKRAAGSLDFFLSCDGQSIPFGQNWVAQISDALSKATLMFVFLSPTSAASKWIHFEAGCAYTKNIKVVPVCLPGMDLNRVTPPINLLQGFNLHSFEAMSNLSRICNERFDMGMDEVFTAQDFQSIVELGNPHSQGFFGQSSWAVEQISFNTTQVILQSESFDPLPQFVQICESAKLEHLLEDLDSISTESLRELQLPGCVIRVFESRRAGQPGTDQWKEILVHCEMSPELFHINAPMLDQWYSNGCFPKPWSAAFVLNNEVMIERVRHKLTTKLYNTQIRALPGAKFSFEGLTFAFDVTTAALISFEAIGNMSDPRWARLISRLIELDVILERPPLRDGIF